MHHHDKTHGDHHLGTTTGGVAPTAGTGLGAGAGVHDTTSRGLSHDHQGLGRDDNVGDKQHHYGRDAAMGAGALGTAGLGAHEYKKHHDSQGVNAPGTTHAVAPGGGLGGLGGGVPNTGNTMGTTTATGVSHDRTAATEGHRHHLGRDAAVAGAGGLAAGEMAHHHNEKNLDHHAGTGLGRDHLGRDNLGSTTGAGLGHEHNVTGTGIGRDNVGGTHKDHHLGRDAAMVGAGGLAAGELAHHHHQKQHDNNQTGVGLGRDNLGTSTTGTGLGHEHNVTGTGLGRDNVGGTHHGSSHLGSSHLGRDALAGAAVGGVGAHELGKHHDRHDVAHSTQGRLSTSSADAATAAERSPNDGSVPAHAVREQGMTAEDRKMQESLKSMGLTKEDWRNDNFEAVSPPTSPTAAVTGGDGVRNKDNMTGASVAGTAPTTATGQHGTQHHVGRDAALAAGATGIGAHELNKHHDRTTGEGLTGTTGQHHVGRDAAMAGGATGLGAHELNKHDNRQAGNLTGTHHSTTGMDQQSDLSGTQHHQRK